MQKKRHPLVLTAKFIKLSVVEVDHCRASSLMCNASKKTSLVTSTFYLNKKEPAYPQLP